MKKEADSRYKIGVNILLIKPSGYYLMPECNFVLADEKFKTFTQVFACEDTYLDKPCVMIRQWEHESAERREIYIDEGDLRKCLKIAGRERRKSIGKDLSP